jgi:L-amino acid N-acyltransferase YncA
MNSVESLRLVSLRQAEPHDWARLLTWRNESHENMGDQKEIGPVEHWRWLNTIRDKTLIWIVAVGDKCFPVGYVRAGVGVDVEVAIALSSEVQKRGVGKAALKQAVDKIRDLYPTKTITATIRYNNTASLRLFASVGFLPKLAQPKTEFVHVLYSPETQW